MQQIEQYFRDGGFTEYYLDTEQSNTQAIGFYKKIGFEIIAEEQGNVIFRKSL